MATFVHLLDGCEYYCFHKKRHFFFLFFFKYIFLIILGSGVFRRVGRVTRYTPFCLGLISKGEIILPHGQSSLKVSSRYLHIRLRNDHSSTTPIIIWKKNSVDETRQLQYPKRKWDNNSVDETIQHQDPIPSSRGNGIIIIVYMKP